jgi:hypothetical protein
MKRYRKKVSAEWVGFFVVVKSAIVEMIEVLDENVFDEIEIEDEINGLAQDVEAAQQIFSSKLLVDFVDPLDKVDCNSDFPEVSKRKYRRWRNHSLVAEVRITPFDVLQQPQQQESRTNHYEWRRHFDLSIHST